MKIIFLGSGSAFTIGANNYQSNMLVENDNGNGLLIDCGSDARLALHELKLNHRKIDSVYISHLHADHTGGLEWLAFTTYFDNTSKNPTLYIAKSLVDDLWNKVLSGGLSSLDEKEANLDTYFNVSAVEDGGAFSWSGLKFQLVPTIHVSSNKNPVPSYGLFFGPKQLQIFLTTDTQFAPDHFKEYYERAHIIFHDCETSKKQSHIHANYDELKTLDDSIKHKMWLFHYNPGPLPDCKKDGFRGFVQKGQIFDFDNQLSLN